MRRTGLVALAATALLAGTFLVSCGGDDDDDGGDTTPTGTTTTTASTTPGAGEPAAVIDQDDLAFKPTKATVKVGEVVRFTNSETAVHTVTIDGKNVSGNMRKGSVYEWTAPSAGEFKVTCDYHPQMKATITVQ